MLRRISSWSLATFIPLFSPSLTRTACLLCGFRKHPDYYQRCYRCTCLWTLMADWHAPASSACVAAPLSAGLQQPLTTRHRCLSARHRLPSRRPVLHVFAYIWKLQSEPRSSVWLQDDQLRFVFTKTCLSLRTHTGDSTNSNHTAEYYFSQTGAINLGQIKSFHLSFLYIF